MEAASTACGVSLSMQPPHHSRKGWRAVSEQHSARNAGEKSERAKQSDQRAMYEQVRERLDVDFCSITIDENLNDGILEERLEDLARQRKQLQQMEVELKVQIIARSEILEIQKNFDAQVKKYADATQKLEDGIHEKEHALHELQRKIEDRDRELHTIKLDKEAAWAQENILREQDKELATYRQERDHSEVERVRNMKQMHGLEEHIQEKERQLIELQEQHRVAQETILYKDEQLREAQAWIVRVQEMDALQSATNQSLQAELRERTEQYNQLWLGCQRQFAEMERLHMHAIQQLQLELADARERSEVYKDDAHASPTSSKDASQWGKTNENQLDCNGDAASSTYPDALPNGNSEHVRSLASNANLSSQTDHVSGIPITPSLLGMPAYIPTGQVTALHQILMQQGVLHSVSAAPHSHAANFHSVPTSSIQECPSQQAPVEGSNISKQINIELSENDKDLTKSGYDMSGNGQSLHPDDLDVHIAQRTESDSRTNHRETQVESIDTGYLVSPQLEQDQQQNFSQCHAALSLDPHQLESEAKEQNVVTLINHVQDGRISDREQPNSAVGTFLSNNFSSGSASPSKTGSNSASRVVQPEVFVSATQTNLTILGNTSEPSLLDEKALLASIVRTIPIGGRIRISSTLPNRLAKMLAPLHWHDYKKKYGKLEDFVAGHPELFVIEGDYIQLQEGAQATIAATAAVAKVAAAAAASFPYSSYLPSVAVTPMAQPHRLKKNQQQNGVCVAVSEDLSNVKLLKKHKDYSEVNGVENKPSQLSVLLADGNVGSNRRPSLANVRPSFTLAGKQKGR